MCAENCGGLPYEIMTGVPNQSPANHSQRYVCGLHSTSAILSSQLTGTNAHTNHTVVLVRCPGHASTAPQCPNVRVTYPVNSTIRSNLLLYWILADTIVCYWRYFYSLSIEISFRNCFFVYNDSAAAWNNRKSINLNFIYKYGLVSCLQWPRWCICVVGLAEGTHHKPHYHLPIWAIACIQ